METIKIGNLEYLAAPGITVPHGFTTRLGGVSTGSLASLNLGMHRGDSRENVAENYTILGNALGFGLDDLVLTRQTHSHIVRRVSRRDCRGIDHRDYPECDGLITRDPGVALVIFTADCTPVLFHDPVTGAVGAAHAGWRGTAGDIVGETVEAMVTAFGCNPENIHAAIGPNIGPCCFRTDRDVPEALAAVLGEEAWQFVAFREGKYYPDLKKINQALLRRRGVTHIDVSEDCTMCRHRRFWSHRYTGGDRGSQGAVILCKEATP